MEDKTELAYKSENISGKLLKSIYLLDVLYDLIGGKAKEGTIINILKEDVEFAFKEVENCREIIETIN